MVSLTKWYLSWDVRAPPRLLQEFARDSAAASPRTDARALAPGSTDDWYLRYFSGHGTMSAPVDHAMTSMCVQDTMASLIAFHASLSMLSNF